MPLEKFLLGVKVALRFYNSHALVNMAVWTKASSSGNAIADARIAVGCPTLFREGSGAFPPTSGYPPQPNPLPCSACSPQVCVNF